MRLEVGFLVLVAGLTACAPAPGSEPAMTLTRKAPTATRTATTAPDPFAEQGHGHLVAEEPGVTYTASKGDTPLFIHGRYAARWIDTAIALTLDFHHETLASAVLRFNGVKAGFKKEDLTSGGLQVTGLKGEVWGLTVEKDREAFLKGLTLDATTGTIKGSFKGEVRPFYGGAEGRFPIAIAFETPFPTEAGPLFGPEPQSALRITVP